MSDKNLSQHAEPTPMKSPRRGFLHQLFLAPDDGRIVIGQDATAKTGQAIGSHQSTAFRLRWFWRMTFWIALTMLIAVVINLVLQAVVAGIAWVIKTDSISWQLVSSLSMLIVFTISIFLARRWFDRRSIRSLGLHWNRDARRDLLAGFLIAAVMMFLMFFIQRLGGWISVTSYAWKEPDQDQWLLNSLIMLAVFIGVGWQEELVSRGYLMHNLADSWLSPSNRVKVIMAVVVTSTTFGLMHLGNPNATWIGALGTGLAGVFLAYGLIASGQLWLPIGIHIGWNFFEGPILGFPVSGLNDFIPMVRLEILGPEWLTGGAFGPEAGAILLPALALGTFLVWWYTRGGLKRP